MVKYTYGNRYDNPANNFGAGSNNLAANVRPIRDRFTNMDMDGTGNGWAFTDSTNIQNIYIMSAEKSASNQDIRHRFVGSAVYELPFGRGKHFGRQMSAPADALLGGWQLNVILTKQSGQPIALVANNVAGINGATQRVNRASGVEPAYEASAPRNNVRQGRPWFNTAAFLQPAAFTLGNASRTIDSLRLDGLRNLDLSLFKTFRIMEKARAEFVNLNNSVVFGAPQGNVTSTQFGIVTSQANAPRVIQIGLKVSF